MLNRYVVETCHQGFDWCVRRATTNEIADPEEETLPLEEARELATETAAEFGTRWYDFSSDAAPE